MSSCQIQTPYSRFQQLAGGAMGRSPQEPERWAQWQGWLLLTEAA